MDLFDITYLETNNYLVVDFEVDTSHGDYGSPVYRDNKLLLAAWKLGGSDTVKYAWGNEFQQQELLHDISNAALVVAHNAKYELGWLKRAGMHIADVPTFDAMLAEMVLLGNRHRPEYGNVSTSLDAIYRRMGGQRKDPLVDALIRGGVNPVRIPRKWLLGRCVQDVRSTEEVFLQQREKLRARGQLGVAWTRFLTTPTLAEIEFTGMHLDAQRVAEEVGTYRERMNALEAEMRDISGGINWRSGKQVGAFLYDVLKFEELRNKRGEPMRTAKGARLTDKNTLARLKASTPEQKRFLELRAEIGKTGFALSKNLEFFDGVCREQNGTFFGEFHQNRTATHRLSSTGKPQKFECYEGEKSTQFQNMPRAFKRLFTARRHGWKILEWDGSQIEFRVGVHLGQDPQGKDDIASGHDVHKFTGACLFHAPLKMLKRVESHMREIEELMAAVDKPQRQGSKTHTFKPLYGGRSGTSREKAYYAAFRARYKRLADTQQEWVYRVCESPENELVTPWGMRFYFPGAKLEHDGYCQFSPSIYNYPVQCLATAEIIPIALVCFRKLLFENGLDELCVIVNTVHDSVVCEIEPSAVERVIALIAEAWQMTVEYLDVIYDMTFFVPLGTEISVGDHWGEPTIVEKLTIHPDRRLQWAERQAS